MKRSVAVCVLSTTVVGWLLLHIPGDDVPHLIGDLLLIIANGLCLWRLSAAMRHRHEWDATAVNWHNIYSTLGPDDRPIRMETQVLRVCISCGKRDVETLDGRWTLEQVRGLMAPTPVHSAS